MIVSASRRTDIPARYFDWFERRLAAGYVLTKNPFNAAQIRRVGLSPEETDGFVFWTKNAAPMLPKLGLLRDYAWYVQYTVNPYGRDAEANLPPLEERLDTFSRLSDAAGPGRTVWRYDPIFLNAKYSASFHADAFEKLCRRLGPYTRTCNVSFVEMYACARRGMRPLEPEEPSPETKARLLALFGEIGRSYGVAVRACAQKADVEALGIQKARCVDASILEAQLGRALDAAADRNQRDGCRCVKSVDIGAYDTCGNGCAYCYASHSPKTLKRNLEAYDPASPLLCGSVPG